MNKWLRYGILLLGVPAVVAAGVLFFADRRYNLAAVLIALLSCIPFFLRYERRRPTAKEIVIVAVMTALSCVGRAVFSVVPAFKPVTAMVIISGLYLGAEPAFVVGTFTALVSNLFFGLGPWTPFQMFVWGLIGFITGIAAKHKIKSRAAICVWGAIAGVIFSVCMDVWTVLSVDGTFSWTRYLAVLATGLPFMFLYALSNVIFLLCLEPLFGRKLDRIRKKYRIFEQQ